VSLSPTDIYRRRLLSAAASIISPNEDAGIRERIQKRVIICHSVEGEPVPFSVAGTATSAC